MRSTSSAKMFLPLIPNDLLAKVLSENLTAKQLSAVSQANREINSFVKDNMQFSLIDINSQGDGTFFTYANEQGQKKFFVCGSNAYGQLGLGHNRNVTVPEEIPTPEAAEGFALTDVQIKTVVHFLVKRWRESYLLVVLINMVS